MKKFLVMACIAAASMIALPAVAQTEYVHCTAWQSRLVTSE